MSRLNELIQELCPDGVEYRRLGQICKLEKGKTAIQKAIPGEYPLVVTTSERKTNRTYQFNSPSVCIPLVSSRGHGVASLNQVYYQEGKFALGNILCGVTPIDDEYVNAKYLFYYLNHNKDTLLVPLMRGGANVSLTVDSLERVQVPIPPLRIQHKIVSMLELFEKYILELSAELSARRKQYEYYRNQLLQFDSGIQRIALGDLFEFRNGLSKGKEFFGKGTPFIRYTDVYNNRFLRKKDITALVECTSDEIDKLKVSRGDVLFTRTSETAEDVGWSSVMLDDIGDCVFNGFTIRATPTTDKLLPEYCAFCFSTDEFRDYVIRNCAFTTRASLTGKTIANYRLAVPPIIIQKRIAEVLFSFDKICSDLDIGLPAEIEARTKQYEFYRDQLLTFAESGKTILTTRHDTTRHDTTRHDTTRHDTTRHDTTQHDTTRHCLIKLLQYVFGYADAKLSDMADVFRGEYITKKGMTEGNIPVILGGQEPAYYINQSNHDGEIVVVARSGVSAGFVSYWNEPVFVTDGFGYEAVEEIIIPKFLYYAMKNREAEMNSMKRGAGVPHVSGEALADMEFIIPSIHRQKEIVATLDRFDELCNDIENGLPAEIEARTKQYEHYRDKLLTFKRK